MNQRGNRTAAEPLRNVEDVRAIGQCLLREDRSRGQPAFIVWVIGVQCGFRIGDILSLRVGHVAGKGKRIRDYIEIREAKRGKVIKRKLPDDVKQILQAYVDGLDWKGGTKYESYLFESPRNPKNHYSRAWMISRLHEAAALCGIEQSVTTHTMRKTFAYHFIENNKAEFGSEDECIRFLSKEVLRHDSICTTLRYIGVEQDYLDRTTARISFDWGSV